MLQQSHVTKEIKKWFDNQNIIIKMFVRTFNFFGVLELSTHPYSFQYLTNQKWNTVKHLLFVMPEPDKQLKGSSQI